MSSASKFTGNSSSQSLHVHHVLDGLSILRPGPRVVQKMRPPYGQLRFAEAKPPASPSAHPPAAAARRAQLAELVSQKVISESTVLSEYYFLNFFHFYYYLI